jgi:hypothetical protein
MMALVPQPFACEYCGHKFTKEKTLFVHVCEQKRRALAKTEKHVVVGYDAFNRFFKLMQKNKGENKPYEEFCKSPYYNAFVKFGSFVHNVNPLYPDKFIDYVISSGVKLDHWCREELYEKYALDLIRTENVETALQRSVTNMLAWGEANDAAWNHYFLYVSTSRAMFDIKDGKISPWLILNCKSGKDLLQKLNDEQLSAISNILDIPFWLGKFKKNPADVELVKQVVKESKI